jgi:hypothetical protein
MMALLRIPSMGAKGRYPAQDQMASVSSVRMPYVDASWLGFGNSKRDCARCLGGRP